MWISSATLLNEDPVAFAEAEREMLSDPHAPTLVTLRGHLHADLGHDALDRLHGIRVPTLITSGEVDWQVPMRYGLEVSERIAGSRFHLFKGPRASHNLFSEMADDFYRLTLRFLQENSLETSESRPSVQRSERL
jgi:pimeloyl-ACP methyl ester carboxylesterase